MKPHLQKLPLDESTSFVARTYRTPDFEVGWHQHVECELILFTEGTGLSFIGNHVGEFETGDIYFLASNLPHTFQKREAASIASAVVVQFKEDFWGNELLLIPEAKAIKQLLIKATQGLKLKNYLKLQLAPLIKELEEAVGFKRIILLTTCLEAMAQKRDWTALSTQDISSNSDERIEKVIQFTIDNFKESIKLEQVAGIACMGVKSFCSYFKRCTKKTFIDFVNEVRVGYACNLLVDSNRSVLDICYDSGYNTIANFHKQFLKVKGLTPLQYRKSFSAVNIGIEE